MYVEIQRTEGASALLNEDVVEEISKGILAQVWVDLEKDTMQDAQFVGKSIVKAPLFDSLSKKKRPNCLSVSERKLGVLIIVHKTDRTGKKEIGTEIGTGNEALLFRKLFREIAHRSLVDYSSDKRLRLLNVKSCVFGTSHKICKKGLPKEDSDVNTTDNLDKLMKVIEGSRVVYSDQQQDMSDPLKVVVNTQEIDLKRTKIDPSLEKKKANSLPRSRPVTMDIDENENNSDNKKSAADDVSGVDKLVEGIKKIDLASAKRTPDIEKHHVHTVYNDIANHWHSTRYAPWPGVVKFIQSLPKGSLIADIGCGNGKYMQPFYLGNPVSAGHCILGCDRSDKLIEICGQRGFEVCVSDNMTLPYRDGSFDAALSIAVFHHFSSQERRLLALSELSRILKVGGIVIIYAWAQEQENTSRRRFETQDVLVSWKVKSGQNESSSSSSSSSNKKKNIECPDNNSETHSPTNEVVVDDVGPKQDVKAEQTYERYCHVYKEGDLEKLVNSDPHLNVIETYFDSSNWVVKAQKVA